MGILLIFATFYTAWVLIFGDILTFWLGIPIYFMTEYIFVIADIFGKFPPTEIPEKIKIPICIILYILGFLFAIDMDEKKRINQINRQPQSSHQQ